MHKRPLAVIAVFFIFGIVLGRFLPDSVRLFHVFVVALILITLTLTLSLKRERGDRIGSNKREREAHVFLFLSIISLGALLYLNSNIFPSNHISRFLGKDKVKVEIVGTIRSPAEARGVYYGKVNSRYLFEIEVIKGQGTSDKGQGKKIGTAWQKVSGLALIRIQIEKDYQYGDRMRVKGTIKRPGLSSDASRLRSLRSLRSKNIGF